MNDERMFTLLQGRSHGGKLVPDHRRRAEPTLDVDGLATTVTPPRSKKASDLVIAMASDQIWLYTNRAHALMFLDRVDEARALYLQYRDEKDVDSDKSWETAVLEDFAELRKAGLNHPLMDEIEKRFAAGH
jgi:hypothetical protein